MPTKDKPSQKAKLIECKLSNKKAKNCPTFEDYYPGDKYVDIVGFTFYNRGKASYNRERLSPSQIVNQK
jgi:beta-mannanase